MLSRMASHDGLGSPGLDHVAVRLHEEFDALVGAAAVDRQIATTAARFASANIQAFVPLLVQRYTREALRALSTGRHAPPPGALA